jgi:hypothetical protein
MSPSGTLKTNKHMKNTPQCLAERTNEDLARCFRDWFNNYLTTSAFATAYGIKPFEAVIIINAGREIHNVRAQQNANQ